LREAVVVDVQAIRQAYAQTDKDELHGEWDNLLHQELAVCAAHLLKSLLRPTDVIAVGGGRAPLLTVRRSLSGARCDRVVSLCGQLSTSLSVNAGEFDLLTDADHVAFALANALGARPLLTRVALAPRSRDDVKKHREAMRENWDKVTLALVGVGALAGKHPMSRYEESDDLAPVTALLRGVWKMAQEADRRTESAQGRANLGQSPRRLHWIGDILNHLFVAATTRQTEWKELPEKMRRALSRGVRQVNDRTITAGPEVLGAVCERGTVILVAGGSHKLSVIQHVLMQRWATHLVTDDETAAQLLASETAHQR
jgi:DNA-binding transcriptional regulator LsrR (DeoR family)